MNAHLATAWLHAVSLSGNLSQSNRQRGIALLPRFDCSDTGTNWNDLAVEKGIATFAERWQAGLARAERRGTEISGARTIRNMSRGSMPGIDSEAERAARTATLREARKRQKLSQRDIWTQTGIAQSHISQIENGVSNLSLDTMVKLCEFP